MLRRKDCCTALIGCVVCIGGAPALQADVIRLANAGEVRGKVVDTTGTIEAGQVTIETLSGAVVVIDRAQIEFLTRRSLAAEQYERKVRALPDSAEAHWELAEWCRRNGLIRQRAEQLERVVELDNDHERAHYGLGHTLRDGEWVSRDDVMTAQGYVKYKGRYITPQELDLIEKSQADLEEERKWYRQVRLWTTWLTGRHGERRKQGLAQLEQIDDPHAVPAVMRYLGEDENRLLRELAVRILTGIGGPEPVPPLVKLSLLDADEQLRYAATVGITPAQYETALPRYVEELDNDYNVVVNRAAAALGQIADSRAVPDLIDALVTSHRYRVRVPGSDSPSYSFSTSGAFGSGTAQPILTPQVEGLLRTGQLPFGAQVNVVPPPGKELRTKVVTVRHEHQNRDVLEALQRITGQNFGYDERTWRLWWAAEKSGVAE